MVVLTSCLLVLAASSRLRGLLANSALLTIGTVAIALPIGTVLGVVLGKIEIPGRRLMAWLLAGSLFVPLYVQAAAWSAMLGVGGWIPVVFGGGESRPHWFTGWTAAIWIHAMAAVPWAAVLTTASLRAVERRLEEESLLDASPPRVLWRVSLRRGIGGVLTAAVWITVVCFTEIDVTDLFQLRTFAEEIYTEATLGSLSGDAAKLWKSDLAIGVALIGLLACAAMAMMVRWLPVAATVPAEANWKWRPVRGRWVIGMLAWCLAAGVLLLPLVGLIWKAGMDVRQESGEYQRAWSGGKAVEMVVRSPWEHRREWGWSLAIGVSAASGAVMIGIALGWLARVRKNWAKPLAMLIALGLAIPAPLWGVWVIEVLNHSRGSLFAPLTVLYDRTLTAPILVQLIRALPLVSLWLWSQLSSVPRDLVDAARSEGAGPLKQLFRVALPLRLSAVGAAAMVGLLLAFGELSATLLVVPPGVTTISVRVFQLIHQGIDDRVAAVSLAVIGILAILAAAASVVHSFLRRGRVG